MKKYAYNILGLTCLIGLMSFMTACQSTKPPQTVDLGHTILLMPPIGNDKEDFLESLGTDCWTEINKLTKGNVVYSKNLTELNSELSEKNILLNGRFNKTELISIASTLDCGSILCLQVINRESLPPQSVTIKAYWLNINGTEYKTVIYDFNLAIPEQRKIFTEYIRYKADSKNILDRWIKNKGNKFDIETAWLSPSIFNKFVAYIAMNKLIIPTKDETLAAK